MKRIDNLIVVAHPDDEAISFSSVLMKPKTVLVICFQNKYPSDPRLFDYATNVFKLIKWYRTSLNIPVIWLQTIRTLKPLVFGEIDIRTKDHLKNNLISIISILKPKKVYTHNPWGEYAHSEHIFLHEIMKELCKDVIFPDSCIAFDKDTIKRIRKKGKFYDSKKDINYERKKFLELIEEYEVKSVNLSFRKMLFRKYDELGIGLALKYFEDYLRDTGKNQERFFRYKYG